MIESNPKISIFLPVYNGSNYLNETLNSILSQTFDNFELMIVDDSSTDNSLEILNKFASKDSRIRVFKKENGGTVPKAWNYILPHMKGDFFFYTSQDDLMSDDLLEKMIKRQFDTGCDTIIPDMVFYTESKDDYELIGINGDRKKIIKGKEAVILSLDWSIHGFCLRSKNLFLDEFFPEESFDSDEFMTRKLFHKSNGIAFCDGKFLYRQNNSLALTKSFSKKNYYSLLTLLRLYNFLEVNRYNEFIVISKLDAVLRTYFTFTNFYNRNIGLKSKDDKNQISEILLQIKNNLFAIDEKALYKKGTFTQIISLKMKFCTLKSDFLTKIILSAISLKYRYFTKLKINE